MITQLTKSKILTIIDELVEIDQICFEEHYWSTENFLQEKTSKWLHSLVDIEKNVVRGYLIAYQASDERIHISRLAVHPSFQKMGVASSLTQSLRKKLSITVEHPTSEKLEVFYTKNGFRKMNDIELINFVKYMGKKVPENYLTQPPKAVVYLKTPS